MRVVMFYHSLLSDWNHNAAHFLRGVVSDLLDRRHEVEVCEPYDAWSLKNLLADHGAGPVHEFSDAYPALNSIRYRLDQLDLDETLDGADLVLVQEWNDHELIRRLGEHRARTRSYRLLFHDTRCRSFVDAAGVRGGVPYDLSSYDGALVTGEAIRDLYLARGWVERAWVWREAADIRIFYPRVKGLDVETERRRDGETEERRDGEIESVSVPPSLRLSVSPSLCPSVTPSLRLSAPTGDLVWMGDWDDDGRMAQLGEFLVEPARRLNLKTRVYGARYPDHLRETLTGAGIEYAGWAPNYRAPQVFANFKFTIHLPRRRYAAGLQSVPTAGVFEALACGIPLVSAPWDDAENLFTPGKDYLLARDGEEMKRHLGALLANEDLRHELSEHGLRTVLNLHTCTHRVNELLGVCSELQVNSLESMPIVGREYTVAAGKTMI